MKRFIVYTLLIAAFGLFDHVQAQFKNPKISWGLSAGGGHGTNAQDDQWEMQYRGFLQYEIVPQRLIGQFGLGYVGLRAPSSYSAYMGVVDLRALYTPFSLPNLNPYLYGGFGISKGFKNGSSVLGLIPVGIGAQTKISKGILLDINGGYNLSLSDKLDQRRRSDNNLNDFTNSKNDAFYSFSIGLAFSLGGDDEVVDTKKKELADAEARRVKELADAEARRVKELAEAEARLVKQKAEAEARRVKQEADANADAKLAKESAEADARLLAQQKSRDTLIVLEKGKTVVLRGVNFEFNKATLTNDSQTILWRAYNAMVANPAVQVIITGHTDNVGSQEFNQKLSLERAQAVRNWLVEKGIASNRMRTVGRGQNEPVSSNETIIGRAENRRIEFYVQQ